MKKLLLCTILSLFYSLAYSQYFNSAAQVLNHLAANISSLDPIEGQYDVKQNWRTTYYHDVNSWTYFIVKEPITNILTLYAYDTQGFHKSENCKIVKNGSGYKMFWHHCYGAIESQNNGMLLRVSILLDTKGSRYFTGNPYLVDKVHLQYNLAKVYPTYEDYIAAKRKKVEVEVEQPQNWTGTGFALNNNYVVTNYHVIQNANNITLTGINGSFSIKHTASIAATDKNNDLAILKLNGNTSIMDIPYSVNTATSDVGEEVFVLGYPLTATMGDEIKLTTGVISSKSGFQGDITQYQISAPIQPGNSGGPLFDSKGNIVGIVSAKHIGAENVGYAIKASFLKNMVDAVAISNLIPSKNSISSMTLPNKVKKLKNYVYLINCSSKSSSTTAIPSSPSTTTSPRKNAGINNTTPKPKAKTNERDRVCESYGFDDRSLSKEPFISSQVISLSPNIKDIPKGLHLYRVALTDQYTIMEMVVDYGFYKSCSITKEKIAIYAGDSQYKLIKAEGIPLSPQKYTFGDKKNLSFRLYFPPIPRNTKFFHMVENSEDGWKIYNITTNIK